MPQPVPLPMIVWLGSKSSGNDAVGLSTEMAIPSKEPCSPGSEKFGVGAEDTGRLSGTVVTWLAGTVNGGLIAAIWQQ